MGHTILQTNQITVFFKSVGTALDQYQQIYINVLLLGGFIVEDTETSLSKFLEQ